MKDKFIKNIDAESALELARLVTYQQGQIVSKTLAQNGAVSLTLFAFDQNEEISSHESDGDAMVIALDGEGLITIDGKEHMLTKGQTIIMPAKKPHTVYAKKQFKMFLIVVFPQTK